MLLSASKEKLEPGNVKGSMVRAHLDWLKEHHPEVSVQELLKDYPEVAAKLGRGVLASAWYPFAYLIAVDRAIYERFKGQQPDVLRELGRHSARANVTTVISSLSLQEFFRNSVKLHDRFQDYGRAEFEEISNKACRMTYHDYTCYSPYFCESALGFFEECTKLWGGKNAKAVELKCCCRGDDVCLYQMTWSG